MGKRILIAAVLALLLAPVVLVGVLLYTETGVQLLVGQLGRFERLGIHIEGVSGTIAGPLHIARFELDHPRVHVVSHDIVIKLQIRGLWLQTLQTGSFTARDTEVTLRETDTPPSEKPPRFLPSYLRIDARGVELSRVRYTHTSGMVIDATRVTGRVTITSRQLRAREFRVAAQQFDAAGDLRLVAARPMGMKAAVSGTLRTQRGVPLALKSQLDGTLDRLAIKAQMQQPSQASADVLMTRPNDRWRIEGRVDAAAFALNPWLEKPPFSLRNVALRVDANPDQIKVTGNVGLPEFDNHDLTIDARGRYANRTLHIAAADIALNDTSSKMQARGSLVFDGDSPTLDLSARWQSLQWPLHERAIVTSASGDATLRGPMPYDFAVTAQVDGPNIPPAYGSASGVLSKERVSIAQYALNALDGTLAGNAELQFTQPRAWQLGVRATNVNPVELYPQFPGHLTLAANAQGVSLNKKASFTLTVSDLGGTLRNEPVRGSGMVQRDARGWRANGLKAHWADAQLALDGTLRDTIDARWSLTASSLGKLLPQASGSIQSNGTAGGSRKSPHVVGELRAMNLRYAGWSANELNINADIDAAGAPSRLSVLARRIGRGDPLIDTLSMTGEGNAASHSIGIDVTGYAADSRKNPPRAQMKVAGSYDQQIWNATITTTQLSTGDPKQKIAITEPAKIMASRERAALDNLCLVVGAGRLCAEGKWQRDGPWQGTLAGYEIPLATLLPPSGEAAEYAGRIEGRVHAFGAPGQPWQGEAGMRIIDAAIIYRPQGAEPETLNLGTGGLAATATPERIEFSFGVQAFSDTFLYANARLQRDGGTELTKLPLTGDLRARAADANILPLVFPEIDNAAGLLTANAAITGTLALPEIKGRIELANGAFDSYRVNLALRELSLIADLADNGLDFRGNGRAGDGRLDVGGHFTWRGGQSKGNLHLRGNNLLVADLPEYRVVAAPDLKFQIDGTRIDINGDVTIPSARIQPAQIKGAVKVSDDARYVGEHASERAGRFVVRSDVRITMGDDVRVDAFGLQGRIAGGVVTTVHTGDEPIGRGELNVIDGRYEAYGQKLDINRGRLLFDASPLDDPGLDIEARRLIETTTVGLNVRGTLQEPRLTFFSDPSMPQTQIVSYLLTGKSMSSTMSSSDTTSMSSARDTLAFQGGGLLASQLGRRLGLEEVGVESSVNSAGQSNTSLVLGKFLSPRLFISYGISLTEAINTLKLRYTISDKWIFRTEAGSHQSADLEYTIER
jgi:translocation and assembly module TamB